MPSPPDTSSASDQARSRALPRWLVALTLLVAIAAPLWHLHIINRNMPSSHSDLVDEWVGVRDALHGQNPYSAETTRDIQITYYGRPITPADHVADQAFPYPAHLVILLAPLAPLSWEAARRTFLLIIVPLLGISFWLCIRLVNLPVKRTRATAIVFAALCSWPIMWGLRLQQPTLLVASLVFLACFLLSREQGVAAGILLALSTVKPQAVLPLILWLLLWASLRRMWGFVVSLGGTTVLLMVWTERIVPDWFHKWIAALHAYGSSHGGLPLQLVLGRWVGLVCTALLVAYSAFLLWRLRRCPARSAEFGFAVSFALAVTVCSNLTFLPVIYNQILLLPACLILVCTKSAEYYPALARRIALALVLWGYAAVAISVIGESVFGSSALWEALPFQNLLLPVAVTIALALKVQAVQPAPQQADPNRSLAVAS